MNENRDVCGYIKDCPVYRFILEPIKSNMYIILYDKNALVIDPFMNHSVKRFLKEKEIQEITILLTHEHYDHISGVNEFRAMYSCRVIANQYTKEKAGASGNHLAKYYLALFLNKPEQEKCAKEMYVEDYTCLIDEAFKDEYEFKWFSIPIQLQETPGHSPGSICITLDHQFVFTGDTLVGGAKIITRLPGGSKKAYLEYTKGYLEELPSNTDIFPGHGEPGKIGEFEIL